MLLVLFVNVEKELLCHGAGKNVLIVKSRTYTKVKWFFGLLLLGTFFETTTFASKSEFNDVVLHATRRILCANFKNSLHVAPFSSDKPPRNLKLFFVLNLDIKATRILHCVSIIILVINALASFVILSWLKLRIRSKFLSIGVWEVENVLSFKQVWLYRDGLLSLIDGILFNGGKITGDRRITLIEFTRLVKALMTHNFWRLGLLFFARHPLDKKRRVVVG